MKVLSIFALAVALGLAAPGVLASKNPPPLPQKSVSVTPSTAPLPQKSFSVMAVTPSLTQKSLSVTPVAASLSQTTPSQTSASVTPMTPAQRRAREEHPPF
jgi:hypothetical protein